MAGVIKGVQERIRYSTDYAYPNGHAGATWTELPIGKVLQDQAQLPREEAVTVQSINGSNLQAGVRNNFALPVAIDDADTFLAALKTASGALSPVWFEFKPIGQNPRVVGGSMGCQVTVADAATAPFGQLATSIIAGSTTGAEPGDTFEVVAGSA